MDLKKKLMYLLDDYLIDNTDRAADRIMEVFPHPGDMKLADVETWAKENQWMLVMISHPDKRQKLIDFVASEIYKRQEDRDIFVIY
jgi:hypothetical protein